MHACTTVCEVRGHRPVASLLGATLFFQAGSLTDLAAKLLARKFQGSSCLHLSTLSPQLTKWLEQLVSKLQGSTFLYPSRAGVTEACPCLPLPAAGHLNQSPHPAGQALNPPSLLLPSPCGLGYFIFVNETSAELPAAGHALLLCLDHCITSGERQTAEGTSKRKCESQTRKEKKK